jgi:hypothetical protein
MTLLSCHLQPISTALLIPPDVPLASAEQQQETRRRAEQRVERATWLCETLSLLAGMYAKPVRPPVLVDTVDDALLVLDVLVNEFVANSELPAWIIRK